MLDRRIFIIRTWLLLIALCGVTLAWPSVGIGIWPLLGMMISTYKCCCGLPCGTVDPACTPWNVPATVTLDVNGFSGTQCTTAPAPSCTALNGTYVLSTFVHDTTFCLWSYSTSFCTAPDNFTTREYRVLVIKSGGDAVVRMALNFAGIGSAQVAWDETTIGAAPANCASLLGTTVNAAWASGATFCDAMSSTADATF